MRSRPTSMPRLGMLAAALVAVLAVGWTQPRPPAVAQSPDQPIFMPLALAAFGGPFATAQVVAPPTTPAATVAATATGAPATATRVPPSATPAPSTTTPGGPPTTPTSGPTPTPTLPGGHVAHPTDADTIVLQIGWTETIEISQVWEEMNGTPWFTLYGDGRVVAGHTLYDRRQPHSEQILYEGRVGEYEMQRWLRALTYTAQVFTLEEKYQHPNESKPWMHLYVNTNGGDKRVSLYGFASWVKIPVDPEREPDAAKIARLLDVVFDIEAYTTAHVAEPYTPECYTVVIQELPEEYLPDPPTWSGPINARQIATAAPTAASNYVNKLPGHKFVNTEAGQEVRDIVVPLAKYWFEGYKLAMEFKVGGDRYGIGARQEVPGGSLFIPDNFREVWYRRDAPSGRCASLPPLAGAAARVTDRLDVSRALGSGAHRRGGPIDASGGGVTAWLAALAGAGGP